MQKPVYFDHQATTPVDPRVLEAMLPYFGPKFGNAASRTHSFGWQADKAVEQARQRVADLAGALPREIVFTSGATESNNLALKGVLEAYRTHGNHVITMATEHRSVLDPIHHLERLGASVTVLPPRPDGLLDLDCLSAAIRPETVLVSVLYANNEIGVIQPVRAIGALCRASGVLFHTDAAQVFGKDLSVAQQIQVVLMSILAGVGTAGVPGGSLPLIVVLMTSLKIPGEGIAIIMGIDRILDMCRTVLNVTGDLVVATCVAGGSEPRKP